MNVLLLSTPSKARKTKKLDYSVQKKTLYGPIKIGQESSLVIKSKFDLVESDVEEDVIRCKSERYFHKLEKKDIISLAMMLAYSLQKKYFSAYEDLFQNMFSPRINLIRNCHL